MSCGLAVLRSCSQGKILRDSMTERSDRLSDGAKRQTFRLLPVEIDHATILPPLVFDVIITLGTEYVEVGAGFGPALAVVDFAVPAGPSLEILTTALIVVYPVTGLAEDLQAEVTDRLLVGDKIVVESVIIRCENIRYLEGGRKHFYLR